jgi:hypothetical protein
VERRLKVYLISPPDDAILWHSNTQSIILLIEEMRKASTFIGGVGQTTAGVLNFVRRKG